MPLLQKISNKFAEKVSTELKYDNDKQEVIAYGTFALLQMILSIALVVVFGLVFKVLVEALIVSFAGSILRKYSGGVHSSSPMICVVVGTVVCVAFGVLTKIEFLTQFYVVLGLTVAVFILAYVIIYKLAPIASKSKPISDKKKVRMKRGSIVVLSVYLLTGGGLFTLYLLTKNENFLNYVFCLSLGTLWQVFTLTKFGEVVLGGLDKFLSRFIKA